MSPAGKKTRARRRAEKLRGLIAHHRKRYYVDDDATPGGDGETWKTAYRTVQDALAEAAAGKRDVTEILVAQGTYGPDEGESQTTGDRAASFLLCWVVVPLLVR